ncbi:NACHT and Ankyrin domain protein [Aspergillus terreus]|uniref:NACHT and Ankyrin domain protein n=1 Tax=Aspergillus terreus TaxID=33178 RepID=A0A5M3Z261_ASPTE|nr:hypothetical protein ATETN484_0006012300 [Aspergillus terreus]GFF19864.1 NACHT and Ankyrin domain protein [Aspergillus terreus]
MVEVSVLRGRLTQAARAVRAITRCSCGGRESQESSQKALLILSELLDLLYQVREQLGWAVEKWVTAPARLNALDEMLSCFESTVRTIEVTFQPGGVSSRTYRKGLLERTFLPRLEQYKTYFIVTLQPDSREKSLVEQQLRGSIREFLDLESTPASGDGESNSGADFHNITSPIVSRNAISLCNVSQQRQKGTCQWIFGEEKYKAWLFGTYRTLFCTGPAGVGKTFLASSIIENIQNTFTSPEVAIVFLFCQEEKEDDQSGSTGMFTNILAQLVHRRGSASYATASLYQSESHAKGKATAKSYQNAIRSEINHFTKVFFIIDGLDMLHDKDKILNRFQKFPDQAQFLFTLRDPRHSEKDVAISVIAPRRDLETYIDSRISQDTHLTSLLRKYSPHLKQAVIQQVIDKAHYVFLLARLHLDVLSRCTDASLLQRALLHLPETLNDAYADSIKQIASQNRPLTVSELKSAIFFEPQNGVAQKEPSSFEQILHTDTAGILTVDPITSTVHLVHKTAKEYLTGAAARVFFPTARKHIAETCLTVITSDEVVDDCYINHGTTPRNPERSSLVNYAATYWGHHAREAPEEEQTTQVLIGAFLKKLCWRRPPANTEYLPEEASIPAQLGLGKYFPDWSALHVLAYFGIIAKALRMIEKGDDVNDQDNSMGITPLHCAAYRGNEEMVELLLDNKADINATCKDGSTAMHLATEQGHRKIMKLLLTRRANSRTANRHGVTALQLAVGTAYDEATVPMLIKSRSDMDAQNSLTGNSTLHIAVELHRSRILLFLLERGASMNVFNKQGLNPLQMAAKTNNCEAMSLLLERGAKVDICSLFGSRALHIAAMEGNWTAFDILLIGGANINAWNSEGDTLLHEQASKARTTSIAAHLLEQGANVEARSAQGYTPIQCAAMSGNKRMFFFLLDNGAKVDVQTAKGESLLHITPPSGPDYLDILIALVKLGLDVGALCSKGWTPLHQTVYVGTGSLDIEFDKTAEYIQLLLSHGADINAPAASLLREAPLHLATMATIPRPSLVSFLVVHGASVNCLTSEGKTPLHLAAERGRDSIFRALLDVGADLTIKISNGGDDDDGEEGGKTPLDIARNHPWGALWFDDQGNLLLADENFQGSIATTIEIESDSGTDDEIGGSTLVGEEGSQWGSVSSAPVISIIE